VQVAADADDVRDETVSEEIVHSHPMQRTTATTAGTGPQVEIRLLGGFRVTVDGVAAPSTGWTRRTAASLIKILALAPGHRLHREKVMDLLWPDESPADCAPRLHKAAHYARRAAGHPDAVVLRNDVVHLFPGAQMTIDVVEFERLARVAANQHDAAAARAALAWYRGELLPGDQYDDWAVDRRELLHLRRLDVLRITGEWRDVTELEPADEEAHVRVMRAHLEAGDGEAALRQYEHLTRVLERELGVTPGPAARGVRREAEALIAAQSTDTPRGVGQLLAELSELVNRQTALLAELAAAGVAPVLVA
jgi:DNA-binding SARP family transcriptional activator